MSGVSHRFYRFIIRPLRFLLGFAHPRLRVKGRENIPEGACVLCANHASLTDPIWIVLAGKFPHVPRTMAKKELIDTPVIGKLVTMLGAFPVNRGTADLNAVKTAMRVLKEGEKLQIFPEGTRIRKGKKSEPHTGAVMIATRMNVPVVPVYITAKKHFLHPIDVVFGEPYFPEHSAPRATQQELEDLTAELMAKIYQMGEDL